MSDKECWTQIANGYNEAIYAKVTVNVDDATCTRLQNLVNIGRQLGIFEKGEGGSNQSSEPPMSQTVIGRVGDNWHGPIDKINYRNILSEHGYSLGESLKHFHQIPGFVKIHPGKYTDFLMAGQDGKVFVSVKTKSEVIADNFPIANNRGIVVDKNGCAYKTRPGSVWTDQYGNEHIPKIKY